MNMTPRMKPVRDASAWTDDDLGLDQSWKFSLPPVQKDNLHQALQQVKMRGLQFAEICQDDLPLPALRDTLQALSHQLRHGTGFAVLSGIPMGKYKINDLEKLYWSLCTYLGTGVTQNDEAGLIHYITDGQLRPQKETRAGQTAAG